MVRRVFEVALVSALIMVTGCNTVAGAGKDVSSVGKTVTNTANDAK